MSRLLFLMIPLLSLSCRDGKLIKCDPSPEVCDGVDNDCNGKIDDELYRPCETPCGKGTEVCGMGAWLGCSARQPSEEVCDGIDDDCDGQVDDNLPISPCYPGDPRDLLHGECRFGISRCAGGQYVCLGAVLPTYDICDLKDNDCNGLVDEHSDGGTDIVFVIDTSCSMGGKIDALKDASVNWAIKYAGNPSVKFALVGAPAPMPTADVPTLIAKLSDALIFKNAVRALTATGTGNEPTIDALWMIAQNDDPLGIEWTPGSGRSMVLFTDEEPQSYSVPAKTTLDALSAISTMGIKIVTYTDNSLWTTPFNPKQFLYGTALETDLDSVIVMGRCQ